MEIKVLAFGIVKDIFGGSSIDLEIANDADAASLKLVLEQRYPGLKKLASYMVAINSEYADAAKKIMQSDEIAIIPPVSGG